MNQRINIPFRGLSTSPSDTACRDGELAMCHNLELRDGELRPVMQPKKEFALPLGAELLYIHSVNGQRLAIYSKGGKLYAEDTETLMTTGAQNARYLPSSELYASVDDITGIGNIIIVSSGGKTHHVRWMGETIGYKYLGEHLPELPKIQFGLHNITIESEDGIPDRYKKLYPDIEQTVNKIKFDGTLFGELLAYDVGDGHSVLLIRFTDADREEAAYDFCMSAISGHHASAANVGAFTEPFLVRYAFRMYDGSTYRMSAPVLMAPESKVRKIGLNVSWMSGGGFAMTGLRYVAPISYLWSRVISAPALEDWKDIIESVDIFISAPIYLYRNESLKEWRKYFDAKTFPSITDSRLTNGCFAYTADIMEDRYVNMTGACETITKSGLQSETLLASDNTIPISSFTGDRFRYPSVTSLIPDSTNIYNENFYFEPVEKRPEELKEELSSVAAFYHAASIPIREITEEKAFRKVNIKAGVLSALVNREALVEDYLSNYNLNGGTMLPYNSRVLRFGAHRDYTTNVTIDTMRPHAWGGLYDDVECFVKMRKNGIEYYASLGTSKMWGDLSRCSWLFYPDPDAFEYVVRKLGITSGTTRMYYTVPLKRHHLLQGAYASAEGDEWITTGQLPWQQKTVNVKQDGSDEVLSGIEAINIPVLSSVSVSEVNNPFVFPSGLSASVGNGNILALAATTLPISEGQQGQFPVMAFTDEGIWALSVSDKGSLIATNPMLRDTLMSPKSLCLVEDGIVYASARGLMLLRGGTAQCITESLDRDLFSANLAYIERADNNVKDTLGKLRKAGGAKEWIRGCTMAYSASFRRLYVFGGGIPYGIALIFSFDTETWSTANFPYSKPVNAYPGTYVQASVYGETAVHDVLTKGEDTGGPKFLVTRPMSVGVTGNLKTIRRAKMNGYTDNESISLFLYASNDCKEWNYRQSSRSNYLGGHSGTPWRWYIVAAVFNQDFTESNTVHDIDIEYVEKYNRRIRP